MPPVNEKEEKIEYEDWLVEFVDKRDKRKHRYIIGVRLPYLVSAETVILRGLVDLYPHAAFSELSFSKIKHGFSLQGNTFSYVG